MAAQARKRGKGGGRKPIGPTAKSSNFSTRIDPETRSELEAEAELANTSVSDMAQKMLKLGIAARRERAREAPTSALLDLIGKLADGCVLAAPTGEKLEWHNHPFICDALRLSISLLLEQEHLRPRAQRDIKEYFSTEQGVHRLYREVLSNPENWANHVFLRLWDDLCSIPPQSLLNIKRQVAPYELNDDDLKHSQYSYDLDRARRALGFTEKKS
jgi:hypothetical protein